MKSGTATAAAQTMEALGAPGRKMTAHKKSRRREGRFFILAGET